MTDGDFAETTDLLLGTLDRLVLEAVSLQPLHGYGLLQRIHQTSGGALQIPQGSIYPACRLFQVLCGRGAPSRARPFVGRRSRERTSGPGSYRNSRGYRL